MDEQKKSSPLVATSIIVLVLVIAAFGAFIYMKQPATVETPITSTPTPAELPTPAPTPTPTTNPTSYLYKDGTYSSTGTYTSPAGAENIGLTITLKNDVITDVQFVSKATFPESKRFQTIFGDNYRPLVVGKKIQDVTLSKVSGSSLTSKGFNDALAKIKASAQV